MLRRLLWVGVFGACLPLSCGLTTRDRDDASQAAPPVTGTRKPSSGGSSTAGGDVSEPPDEASAGSPSTEPDDDAAEPVEIDRVERLVETLEYARYNRAHCLEKLYGPAAADSATLGFFVEDPSAQFQDLGRLKMCLYDYPDQEELAALLDWWWPLLEGARACWQRCQHNDLAPAEACWGAGCFPEMTCPDRAIISEIAECVNPPPDEQP